MKKYTSGFVPIDFRLGGKILFPIGLALILVKGLDYLIGWSVIPMAVLFVGIGLLLLSLYLYFYGTKE